MTALDPPLAVRWLRDLAELTGDADGAQRVAWSDTPHPGARLAAGAPRRDPRASRSTPTRPATSGRRCRARASAAWSSAATLDSVPDGGWLDGALNVVAALSVMRARRGRRRARP